MLFNTNKDARLNVGSCYYRKRNGHVSVRKILDIKDNKVSYKRLYGPASHMKFGETGSATFKAFKRWLTGEVSEGANFASLKGAEIQPSYLVYDSAGSPIFRCTKKKAKFYLSHHYAESVGSEAIRLNEHGRKTEEMLKMLHGDAINPFFFAVKNDKCVCCGQSYNLTRHHVVPKRHKKKIPVDIIRCVSNVLFLCMECHTKYERYSELEPNDGIADPVELVNAWSEHFISTMKPKYLPEGWGIFAMDPIKMRNAG